MTGGLASPLKTRRSRGLWIALTLLVLAVQTALPAHQASHTFGQSDTQCQYCVLGGHLPGMPGVALLPPAGPGRLEAPQHVFASLVPESRPRSVSNRGPPSPRNA